MISKNILGLLSALGLSLACVAPAQAEMILSQVIVDLQPDKPPREDIEVFNSGADRMYVAAEPFEIVAAGTPQEQRKAVRLSDGSGILISPQRLVLEPGERRMIRIALLGDRPVSDRVYRVAIRPVAGRVTADKSALKVFVGYDTLVLVRPQQISDRLEVMRNDSKLVIRNMGNTAQELFDGRQCRSDGSSCASLASKRLYPGATWVQDLPLDTPISYKSAIGSVVRDRRF